MTSKFESLHPVTDLIQPLFFPPFQIKVQFRWKLWHRHNSLTSVSKSMFRIRSASSMTKNFSPRREKPLVFSMWSINRPGVAVTHLVHIITLIIKTENLLLPLLSVTSSTSAQKIQYTEMQRITDWLRTVWFLVLPIIMCGFLANTIDWDIISIPPTMTAATQTGFRQQNLGTSSAL